MADLAAELGAPGLRVFGDTIQPGADRASTRSWIAESIRELAEIDGSDRSRESGSRIMVTLRARARPRQSFSKRPLQKPEWFGTRRTVSWQPRSGPRTVRRDWEGRFAMFTSRIYGAIEMGGNYVLPGEGDFPLLELKAILQDLQYDRFLSFEWEKKWHPEIADAEIALPHFARWFRKNYA